MKKAPAISQFSRKLDLSLQLLIALAGRTVVEPAAVGILDYYRFVEDKHN
jgi:hypothetical protein